VYSNRCRGLDNLPRKMRQASGGQGFPSHVQGMYKPVLAAAEDPYGMFGC
jgi:hypothetical protein